MFKKTAIVPVRLDVASLKSVLFEQMYYCKVPYVSKIFKIKY